MRYAYFIACLAVVFSFAACKKNPLKGYTDTKFGFKIKNHTEGKGAKAQVGDVVEFHQYVRRNDSLIQSTRQMGQPLKARLPEDSHGDKFIEAIKMMAAGDSISIAIPVDSLGEVRAPFKKGEYVFFDFKMLSIKGKAEVEKEMAASASQEVGLHAALDAKLAEYRSGKLKTQKTASGLVYFIAEQGTGAKPESGKKVSVNYIGVLKDGKEFDNSFKKGQPIEFPLGQVQRNEGPYKIFQYQFEFG